MRWCSLCGRLLRQCPRATARAPEVCCEGDPRGDARRAGSYRNIRMPTTCANLRDISRAHLRPPGRQQGGVDAARRGLRYSHSYYFFRDALPSCVGAVIRFVLALPLPAAVTTQSGRLCCLFTWRDLTTRFSWWHALPGDRPPGRVAGGGIANTSIAIARRDGRGAGGLVPWCCGLRAAHLLTVRLRAIWLNSGLSPGCPG